MGSRNRGVMHALRQAVVQAGPACTTADAVLFTGPDAFDDEPAAVRRTREERAKAVCLGCPARMPCLLYAVAVSPREGVWAGLTAEELCGADPRAEVA